MSPENLGTQDDINAARAAAAARMAQTGKSIDDLKNLIGTVRSGNQGPTGPGRGKRMWDAVATKAKKVGGKVIFERKPKKSGGMIEMNLLPGAGRMGGSRVDKKEEGKPATPDSGALSEEQAKTLADLDETISTMAQLVENTTRRLAEIDAELERIEDGEGDSASPMAKRLRRLKKELKNAGRFGRGKLEKEIEMVTKELAAIEEDRGKNPFKYFVIDGMSEEAFKIIFARTKEDATLEDLNNFGETGMELNTNLSFPRSGPDNSNTWFCTSNGFTLQLQNTKEVTTSEGVGIYDDNAKYKLVDPNWTSRDGEDALSYYEGIRLMRQRAEDYHAEQFVNFDDTIIPHELETFQTPEEKRVYLEKKRTERIGNIPIVNQYRKQITEYLNHSEEGVRTWGQELLDSWTTSLQKHLLERTGEHHEPRTREEAQKAIEEIKAINEKFDAMLANLEK